MEQSGVGYLEDVIDKELCFEGVHKNESEHRRLHRCG